MACSREPCPASKFPVLLASRSSPSRPSELLGGKLSRFFVAHPPPRSPSSVTGRSPTATDAQPCSTTRNALMRLLQVSVVAFRHDGLPQPSRGSTAIHRNQFVTAPPETYFLAARRLYIDRYTLPGAARSTTGTRPGPRQSLRRYAVSRPYIGRQPGQSDAQIASGPRQSKAQQQRSPGTPGEPLGSAGLGWGPLGELGESAWTSGRSGRREWNPSRPSLGRGRQRVGAGDCPQHVGLMTLRCLPISLSTSLLNLRASGPSRRTLPRSTPAPRRRKSVLLQHQYLQRRWQAG